MVCFRPLVNFSIDPLMRCNSPWRLISCTQAAIQVVKSNHQLSWFADFCIKASFGEYQHTTLVCRTYIKIFKAVSFYHPVIYGPLARLICKSTVKSQYILKHRCNCIEFYQCHREYILDQLPWPKLFLSSFMRILSVRQWKHTFHTDYENPHPETARIITSKSKYNLHLGDLFRSQSKLKLWPLKFRSWDDR